MPGFRHPAVLSATCHPFGFLSRSFSNSASLTQPELDAVAKEALEPEKNIRPVRSAMINDAGSRHYRPVSLAGLRQRSARLWESPMIFYALPFYDILHEKKIRGILEYPGGRH